MLSCNILLYIRIFIFYIDRGIVVVVTTRSVVVVVVVGSWKSAAAFV